MLLSCLNRFRSGRRTPRRQQPKRPSKYRNLRLETLEDRTVPAVLDLTGGTTSGYLNTGFFELINQQPAGSGVIDSFVRLHDLGPDDTETPEGHNTSGRNQGSPKLNFDENSSPVFTHDLQLKDIPTVKIQGTMYREFRLDLNDPNNSSAPPVSLNKFKLFFSTTGGALATPTELSGELGTLIWDMDGNTASASTSSGADLDGSLASGSPLGNWVNLNDKNHGSGQSDMRVLVPDNLFPSNPNSFIYLYSRFGDTQAMTGGYEEWYVDKVKTEKAVDVVTQIHQTSPIDQLGPLGGGLFTVEFGSTVHDHAFVTDSKGAAVTSGSVTFSFFTTIDCTGDSIDYTDSNGADGWSTEGSDLEVGPLFAGDYSFIARYNGDGNFAQDLSECEPLHVNRGTQGVNYDVATILHDADHDEVANGSAVDLGSVMHDTATVTPTLPSYPTPTGTVTYEFYQDVNQDGDGDDAVDMLVSSQDVTIAADGSVPESSDTGALHPGFYAFRALYSGDTQYDPGTSGWEPFSVNKADVSIRTEVHNNAHEDITNTIIVGGTQVHDWSEVSGDNVPFPITGTVTYYFYNTSDCTGSYTEETVAVGMESSVITPSGGFHSYSAVYNGSDDYNATDASDCEPFTVLKRSGGRTPGFWSNQNGEAQLNDGGTMEPELQLLRDANLKLGGVDFDPTTYAQLQDFLLGTNATNMSDMLSRHLSATILNVEAGFVGGGDLVYVAKFGLTGNAGPGNQFMSVNDLIAAANAELALHPSAYSADPWRAYQEMLKNALAAINQDEAVILP